MALDISLNQWRRLYDLADQILLLKPWEKFYETEIFAIQPEAAGPTYFVSTMGHAEEHYAIAFYRGAEGLGRLRDASSDDLTEELKLETIQLNSNLNLSFEPSRLVAQEDRAIFKAMQRPYRGKWPLFRTHQPALVPWFISKAEADIFELLLEQALLGLKRAELDPELLLDLDAPAFFLRRRTAAGTWEDDRCITATLPVEQRILQAELPDSALDGLARSPRKIEAALKMMLTPTANPTSGLAPFFPYILMLVDAESGMVLALNLLSTADGVDAALVQIPDTLTKSLRAAGFVPAVITARHPVLLSALESYGDLHGITCEHDEELPMASMAMDSLQRSMQN